jgi:hypothetical protein
LQESGLISRVSSRRPIEIATGIAVKNSKNARQNSKSRRVREQQSTVPRRVRARKLPNLLSKSADSRRSLPPEFGAAEPSAEPGNDRQIQTALDGLLGRSLLRGDKGRFIAGAAKTGQHSEPFWIDLAPLKADIVTSVRAQLGADDADAPPTLLAIIDGFAEAHLLRKSTFLQLAQRGGPVTNKGKVRGLLQAWGAFFDREIRAAEKLGLVRKSRRAQTPIEWLESLAATEHQQETEGGHSEHEHAPDLDETGRPS